MITKVNPETLKSIALSPEWAVLESEICEDIERNSERLVSSRGISMEDVIRIQERIATLKFIRETINKMIPNKEE